MIKFYVDFGFILWFNFNCFTLLLFQDHIPDIYMRKVINKLNIVELLLTKFDCEKIDKYL